MARGFPWRASEGVQVLTVACVKVGNKYGNEYVTNLKAGVERHLTVPHEFVCITDAPIDGIKCIEAPDNLPGWWCKIFLFKPGLFPQGAFYLDLDVVVVGDLTPATQVTEFTLIKDWWLPGFNSSVMRLTGNEDLWDKFDPNARAKYYMGDQHFISEMMPDAETFPPEWFPSYKANRCQDGPPNDAMAVIFHGEPKPSQLGGWVREKWCQRTSSDRLKATA